MENNYLRVGVIANTHGIKGEVKVYPTTDDINRFDNLKEAILDTGKDYINLKIQGVKYFKNMVIVKFKGIDNINDIEKYKGKDLLVTRENAVPLEENEYYIADLIDMEVYDENGEKLGVLYDVMQTGANDVYVIRLDSGKELLLPNIDQCILEVNVEDKKMKVHILEGLME
ncbi:MAG: ribosome maturation factor RimM [Lachnospiraceae bacterium]